MKNHEVVDLRSDTLTRPTEDMRRAMAAAEVGDDVYDEDPTVRTLQARAAELLGFEASLFVPTGTMGNQIAIHLHTEPGTEVLVDDGCHVYNYELAAMAAWSGAMPRVLFSERGKLDPAAMAAAIAPDIYYMARARVVVVENSHNHAGGVVTTVAHKDRVLATARDHGLRAHLDGARIFNAAAALEVEPAEVARGFDTVMFCLSKGLGAPVGSLLCGSGEAIERARVVRKRMGGGMRQVGVLAAAGLVALERHVARIPEDHARARRIADILARDPRFEIDPSTVETNIVVAGVRPPQRVDSILADLAGRGIRALGMGPGRIRFVTHLDIDDAGIDRFEAALASM